MGFVIEFPDWIPFLATNYFLETMSLLKYGFPPLTMTLFGSSTIS